MRKSALKSLKRSIPTAAELFDCEALGPQPNSSTCYEVKPQQSKEVGERALATLTSLIEAGPTSQTRAEVCCIKAQVALDSQRYREVVGWVDSIDPGGVSTGGTRAQLVFIKALAQLSLMNLRRTMIDRGFRDSPQR